MRKVLHRIGSTWRATPIRRMIQGIGLTLFLILFFYVCWPYGSPDYDQTRQQKEIIDAEIFLLLDPLVGISTVLAAKVWVPALIAVGILLLISLVLPRGFCGYLCPLGTMIDLFDWMLGKRITLVKTNTNRWWKNLKYFILAATLIAALFGILLSGFVAAIPVLTRGMFFLLSPLQIGIHKDWYLVPPFHAAHYVSLSLFLLVFLLSFLQNRFWCKYVCPTGAVFSVANWFRLSERQVETTCIKCSQCQKVCSFDAIKPDYTTQPFNCSFCQSCGGVCPTQAIQFCFRWDTANAKMPVPVDTNIHRRQRRNFLVGSAAALGVGSLTSLAFQKSSKDISQSPPVRPPGSVPEAKFLQLCIRCGQCYQACPNNVLHPMGFERGPDFVWTPQVVANWAGCEPSCNNCGQVCPTGAIRPLPIEEKRLVHMGLAVVNEKTCLPYAQREECQMCKDECDAAGYHAIVFRREGTQADADGQAIEGTGFLAPEVVPDLCVGCGLCQTRCHNINVKEKKLLEETAIRIIAGAGNEDRILHGSYQQLRQKHSEENRQESVIEEPNNAYLPDFLR